MALLPDLRVYSALILGRSGERRSMEMNDDSISYFKTGFTMGYFLTFSIVVCATRDNELESIPVSIA